MTDKKNPNIVELPKPTAGPTLTDTMAVINRDIEGHIEFQKYKTRLARVTFEEAIKQGFDPQQAITLALGVLNK